MTDYQAPQPPHTPGHDNDEYDDYESASRSTADYLRAVRPRKSHKKAWIIILIILFVLTIAAAAAFWIKNRPAKPATNTSTPTQTVQKPVIKTETKQLDSTEFAGLSLKYPADWTVTETAGSGRAVIRSTPLQLHDANNQTMNGQIVLTIRNKQQPLPEFDAGSAIAAKLSEKIAYTKPSQTQRAETYVSFLRYAKTTNQTAMEGVYVTGDFGYQKDQFIPKADIARADPIITITFLKCADAQCTGTSIPTSVADTFWEDKDLAIPVKTMLMSLVVD